MGFVSIYLTDSQRSSIRKNCIPLNLDPVLIEAIIRKPIFPKCSEGLFEYRSLKINNNSHDHLVLSGFFDQPIVSVLNSLGPIGTVSCQYEYLEVETDKIHSGVWRLTHFNSITQINDQRADIENIAKRFFFNFDEYSFTANPLPIIERYQLLSSEAKTIRSQTPGYSITIAKELGSRIAQINSWTLDISLTKKNRRPVFISRYTKKYLAIDTQHPHFEVHDSSGKHLGSVPFFGGDPENRKDHTLNLT
jgi:hypothetical protein